MDNLKFASLMLIILALIIFILAGNYNPSSVSVTLAPGQIKSLVFEMNAGERRIFELKGTDYFTFYIMNSTSYERMEESNFTDSIYMDTTEHTKIEFTAPEGGKYYIVIANINSPGFIQVVVEYAPDNQALLLSVGSILVAASLLLIIWSYRRSKRPLYSLTGRCPRCGKPVDSTWKYCPYCRQELGRDGR